MRIQSLAAVVAAVVLTVTPALAVLAQQPPDLGGSLAALTSLAGAQVQVTLSQPDGRVTFLTTTPGTPIPVHGRSAEERARAFLVDQAGLFGLLAADELLTERVSVPDLVGMEHVRFQQTVRGVAVAGGEVGVHLRGSGVVAVHAHLRPGLQGISTQPTLNAATARDLAAEALARDFDLADVELSKPRLEILDRAHLGGPPAPVRLAWFVEARRLDVREYLWIDARLGAVLLRFSQLNDALDRDVYDADDPGDGVYNTLPGVLVRSEGDAASGDSDADDAYDFSGDTYDYYSTVHGRDSYDDAGSTLVSSVHFCPSAGSCPYANAFWNGSQMVYGDGFPAADDVDAHELTHAVTDTSAELFYYMQSGALNESFSDIFGETVDLTNGSGTDTAGVRWLLGEDVPGFGAIRDMMNPQDFADPPDLSSPYFVCAAPGSDKGGVHTNSGVPNHAYALLADGGTYGGVTVSGLGLTKAAKIEYRALTEYLLSASGFLDDVNALEQSCVDLVGTAGITAADCQQVRNALDAVEMAEPWPCGQTTPPALCGVGQTASDLFHDDFEELAGGNVNNPGLLSDWTQQLLTGGTGLWSVCCLGPFATSGTGNLWGYDAAATRDTAIAMTTDVAVPAGGAFVQFDHSYGFDDAYDGGVIEYSVNGGSTWLDAGSLISQGAAYTGTVSNLYGNPLGGRSAFVGDTFGYTASQLDLASLAGEDVRFRFRIGTDAIVDDYGWFVDEFRVYTCGAAGCTPVIVLDEGTVTGVESHDACTSITAGTHYRVGPTGELTLQAPLVTFVDGFTVGPGGSLTVRN